MSHYGDDQSEDGELARSPVLIQDEMDFSLSDEDREQADSLVIKPPQAVVRPSHRERRGRKRTGKERHKDSRRDKKHVYRDKPEKLKREISTKNPSRDNSKEQYKEKAYYKEKELFRDKEIREKDVYREREVRDKDVYRETREKEVYREKEREIYREKEAFRDRDYYREREIYRDNVPYRDKEMGRTKETFRDKDTFREKDKKELKDKESYQGKERQRHPDLERRQRSEPERNESRQKGNPEEAQHHSEKENLRDQTSGDKELEDLRSRLLSKRIVKDFHGHDSRKGSEDKDKQERKSQKESALDKSQHERRKRLLEADREMEKRKQSSRDELEARREERRRRGRKRTVSPDSDSARKKNRVEHQEPNEDNVVTVSDASDVEMKSPSQHSEQEEGEHTGTDTEEGSTSSETASEEESKSEDDDDHNEAKSEDEEDHEEEKVNSDKEKILSRSPANKSDQRSPPSNTSKRSHSRSRSRSHSFSPPPPDENGKSGTEEEKAAEVPQKDIDDKINSMPPYFPALQGCRSVEEFQCLNRIEEGTYGVVYRARDKTTEEIVALKRLKMEKEKEGFPITSLREINTLLKGQHPNIVTVREIVVGSNMDKIFIVMDYVEHDLKSLMETMRGKKQVFLPGEVKCLMTQLLKAVHHLHDNWILHRDLKTSNLLLSHKGILKVGDFGLAREYGSPLRQYTPIVVTLWYRAPELLLCGKEYSTPIDMWSVGCIFAEFVTMHPLFPGKSEVDQLNRIFKDLGTPSEAVWPGYGQLPAVQKMTFAEHPPGGLRQRAGPDLLTDTGLALLQGFLTYDPVKRVSADTALEHAYFKEQPVAIEPAMFPTWPAKSEGGRRSTHSPRPPAGGAAAARDSDDSLGFHMATAPAQPRSLHVAPGFSLKF